MNNKLNYFKLKFIKIKNQYFYNKLINKFN